MSHPTDQAAGAAIGGILGFIKSVLMISALTWQVVYETALLATVGAIAGYLATALMKTLTKKIQSWKKKESKS